MNNRNMPENQPAFPISDVDEKPYWSGLTKLEHFAGLAMQGILASPNLNIDLAEKLIAEAAIVQAKALLDELEKQK